jgi:hypothetical protein
MNSNLRRRLTGAAYGCYLWCGLAAIALSASDFWRVGDSSPWGLVVFPLAMGSWVMAPLGLVASIVLLPDPILTALGFWPLGIALASACHIQLPYLWLIFSYGLLATAASCWHFGSAFWRRSTMG